MWFDFATFAPIGYVPSAGDVMTKIDQMESTADMMPRSTPVVVYVIDKETPPAAGTLRRLNADRDVIASLVKFAQTIEAYNNDKTNENKVVMDEHYVALRHVVLDFE